MLSYQHAYHAGNLADVHKHSLLAWMLAYLTRKDKPLSYLETHAGRAIYDLSDAAAAKTGEAEAGIARTLPWFSAEHPYARAITATRAAHGGQSYPGSPAIAAHLLRAQDRMDLAELHPGEFNALRNAMSPLPAKCHRQDGFALAHAMIPPTPRRGMILVDPSYELKTDYEAIPGHIAKWHRAWNVGIIALWYPVLTSKTHQAMADRLQASYAGALRHEVRFAPARPGHGMVGSGLFVVNPPFGMAQEAARLNSHFDAL
ncbi:MAG: 23S rRNA (adenine(2030)-N(6))-methyltransferase RlmJ [Pseudomonadota bacterium]